MKKLNEKVRAELKKPLGRVCSEKEAVQAAKQAKGRVICVGDSCAYAMLQNSVEPRVIVYDLKTLRKRVSEDVANRLSGLPWKKARAANPAGFITDELFSVLENALGEKERVAIFVEGEEDLAALPALALAEEGELVFYGQPGQGIVCIRVSEETRSKAEKLLREMDDA